MRRMLLVCLVFVGCRHADTLTAVEHEERAQLHRSKAAQADAQVRVEETTRPMPSATESEQQPMANAGFAQGRAGREIALAEDDEKAAARIRHDAEAACARVPREQRRPCPVPRPKAIEDLPGGGVRIVVDAEGERLRDDVKCALAMIHVDRYAEESTCPLFVGPKQPRVVDTARGTAIEIPTDDAAQAAEVRRRAELLQKQ